MENKITKLTPFKMQCLTNFPFIDEDFDALSNYGLLCKIVEYINKVAVNNNLVIDEVDKLNNWFNNLDVQNEIDNKLDKMVEDGTFDNIINQTLFNNLNDKIDTVEANNNDNISLLKEEIIKNTHGFFNKYGTQIKDLINILSDEFRGKALIYLIGDSITWGMNANPMGVTTGRNLSLNDPRNVYNSPSYANKVADFLGNYNLVSSEVTYSNWDSSPSGDSIRTYKGICSNGFFSVNSSIDTVINGNPIQVSYFRQGFTLPNHKGSYGILVTENYNDDGTSYASLKFNVTKLSSINLFVVPLQNTAARVMETKIGAYYNNELLSEYIVTSNQINANGCYDLEVNFGYDITGEIEIRYSSNGVAGETGVTYRGGIYGYYFEKEIKVINQGIIGITTTMLLENVVNQGGIVNADFVITQVGTNDRMKHNNANHGDAFSGLYNSLTNLDNAIKQITPNRIYMASNNCNDVSNQLINQRQVRNSIKKFCLDNEIDFIDNYQASLNYDKNLILSDGLHPNNLGHELIANNVITSITNC